MKKSDLRTGMLVTLRNGENYYVLLNSCPTSCDQHNVLLQNSGRTMGWMPLDQYDDDMKYHDDPNSIFPSDPADDPEWDIMAVRSAEYAVSMFIADKYKVIWKRKE